MKSKEYSRSTNIGNAAELYGDLSPSDKTLIEAMMSTMFVLMQNIQRLQSGYNSGTTLTQTAPPPQKTKHE